MVGGLPEEVGVLGGRQQRRENQYYYKSIKNKIEFTKIKYEIIPSSELPRNFYYYRSYS